jgi:hypothetical protein
MPDMIRQRIKQTALDGRDSTITFIRSCIIAEFGTRWGSSSSAGVCSGIFRHLSVTLFSSPRRLRNFPLIFDAAQAREFYQR